MPKTKFQSIVFTLIMVFCMVFCMTVYTVAIKTGGLSYSTFLTAIREMWLEYVIVFVLIFFVISKVAQKLAFRIVNPKEDREILVILTIQSFTVLCIVPVVTLIATFLHNGFTADWFTQWITSAFLCFPAAYCLQVFLVGPLVRFIFRCLFAKQLKPALTDTSA